MARVRLYGRRSAQDGVEHMAKSRMIGPMDRLSGYPRDDGALTDWNGNKIGICTVTSRRARRVGSPGDWISSHVVYYRCATLDGRQWVGRGAGSGMHLGLREARTKVKL